MPVYLKDIADVTDATEDRRSFMRINGTPGIRMQVTKQSGTNTIQIAEGVREEIAKINQEVQGLKLNVLDDQSRFISRAIGSVQEHAHDRRPARDPDHLPVPARLQVDARSSARRSRSR